jgi:hypothetical protein
MKFRKAFLGKPKQPRRTNKLSTSVHGITYTKYGHGHDMNIRAGLNPVPAHVFPITGAITGVPMMVVAHCECTMRGIYFHSTRAS